MKHYNYLMALALGAACAFSSQAQPAFYECQKGEQHQDSRAQLSASRAEDKFELAYVGLNETMWNDYGIKVNEKCRVGIAIIFPKDKIESYVGMEVTTLSFGWNTQQFSPTVDCFIRSTLDGEDLATAQMTLRNRTEDFQNWCGSWNKTKLDEPYVIQADQDLIFGYYADLEPVSSYDSCIPYSSYGNYNEGTQYIINMSLPEEEGGQEWFELWNENEDKPTAPLFASLTIVDSTGNAADLCQALDAYCLPIMGIGEPRDGFLNITNKGTTDIEEIEITYAFGDEKVVETYEMSPIIEPGSLLNLRMPFHALGTGEHTLTITKVNGADNGMAKPLPYTTVGVPADVAENYVMTPLVEYFSSENNHLSVRYFEDLVMEGIKDILDKVVMVNQHVDDQFMLFDPEAGNEFDDATTMLLDYANGDKSEVKLPVIVVNRTALPLFYDMSHMPWTPVSQVITPMFAYEVLYEPALSTPTFASVNAEITELKEDGTFDVTVSGHIADGILPEGETVCLTVYIMEDNVESDSQELPDDEEFLARYPDGIYKQQNVIRECLTPMYGQEMMESGDFSTTFTVKPAEDWNLDYVSATAILSRPSANTNLTRNVINACEMLFNPAAAAPAVEADSNEAVEIYNLNGMRMAGNALAPGVYIVKKGNAVRKIVK